MLEPYTLDFFKVVNRDEDKQAVALQEAIIKRFNPQSVIDFGCATGLYLTQFTCPKMGVDVTEEAFNDDVRMVDRNLLSVVDLTKPYNPFTSSASSRWGLGICIEVLEHIEEQFTDQVIKNMINCSDTWIVTAAQPGQAGTNHVNCQPQEYWENNFKQYGFKRDYYDEIHLIYPVSLVPHQFWMIRNLMVFKKII